MVHFPDSHKGSGGHTDDTPTAKAQNGLILYGVIRDVYSSYKLVHHTLIHGWNKILSISYENI